MTASPLIYVPHLRAEIQGAIEALGGERPAHRATGLDRMTLRRWSGKPHAGRETDTMAHRETLRRLSQAAALEGFAGLEEKIRDTP